MTSVPPLIVLPAPGPTAFTTPVLRGPKGDAGDSGDDSGVVHTSGDETVAGNKTFTAPIVDRASNARVGVANTATAQASAPAVATYSEAETMTGPAGVILQAPIFDTDASSVFGELAWSDRQGNWLSSILQIYPGYAIVLYEMIDANGSKIINLPDGTDPGDAVNKGQLDAVSGANAVFGEVPLRVGTMATLTIGNNFVAGSTSVFRNGLREQLGVGYTESSANTITLTTAPLTSDVISVDYLIAT